MAQTASRTKRITIKPQSEKPFGRLVMKKKGALEPSINAGNTAPKTTRPTSSYHSPTGRYHLPMKTITPKKFLADERTAKGHAGKENAGSRAEADLESRIRAALTLSAGDKHPTPRDTFSPPPFKFPKVDPAIVSFGPVSKAPNNFRTRIPVSSSPTKRISITPYHDHDPFKECVGTIVRWHAKDKPKFQKLLNALKEVDSSEASTPSSDDGLSDHSTSTTINITTSKSKTSTVKLDPQAKPFCGFTTMRGQLESKTRYAKPNHNTHRIHNPRVRPRLSLDIPFATTGQVTVSDVPTGPAHGFVVPPPTLCSLPILLANTLDDDQLPGRSARVLEPYFAKRLLDSFSAKYPMTGRVKAAAPATVQGRHAAAIQQRLEYLLLQKKEREAGERKNQEV